MLARRILGQIRPINQLRPSILALYRPTMLSTAGTLRPLSTTSQLLMRSDEYHPISKVTTDPKTGKRILTTPMTVNEELPDPLIGSKNSRNAFLLFCVIMSVSLFGIFNYEKVSSPIMNATMYFLRRSDVARSRIGKEITFEGLFPWVKGELNTMKGNIDVRVWVSGDKSKALMCLKAHRESRMHAFRIEKWELIFEGGETIDLLADQSIDLVF